MKKISRIWEYLEEIILVVSLSVMTLITFANVLSQRFYISRGPLGGTDCHSIYFLIFGWSSCSCKKGRADWFNIIVRSLPDEAAKNFFRCIPNRFPIFYFLMVYCGLDMVRSEIISGMKTPAMGLPEWIFGLSIPVGSLFLGLQLVS